MPRLSPVLGGACIQPGHTPIEVNTTPFHLQDLSHPAAGRQGKSHHRYEVPGQFLQQSIRFLSLEKTNATLGFFEHTNLRDSRDPFPVVARHVENTPDDFESSVDGGILDTVDLLSILDERPQRSATSITISCGGCSHFMKTLSVKFMSILIQVFAHI